MFKTAAKTAIILVILDMLRVTKDAPWFEVRRAAVQQERGAQSLTPPCRVLNRSTSISSACRPRCSTARRADGGARRGA